MSDLPRNVSVPGGESSPAAEHRTPSETMADRSSSDDEYYSPPDLAVSLVWRHLPWHLARVTFRAVCRDWRHRPTPPTLICFNNDRFQSLTDGELPRPRFAPAFRTVAKRRGCHDDWLLYWHQFDASRPPTCSLSNPLSGASVAALPLSRDDEAGLMWFPMPKAIVCSPDLVAALLCGASVAFCRPGDPAWSVSPSRDETDGRWCVSFTDIALYRGKVYALRGCNDDIFVHELVVAGGEEEANTSRAASKHVVMAPATSSSKERCLRRLVVCRGKLLMVRLSAPAGKRNIDEEVNVAVLEADLETGRWLEVDDLGDHALFVGTGCSKALLVTGDDDERVQGNRVYFLGRDLRKFCSGLDYRDCPTYGYYDLKNGTISQVFLSGRWNVWPQHSMEWFFPCD